ncbi:hypothetical protein ACWGB8_30410 [Kitasatospora sp. NPDC054939]
MKLRPTHARRTDAAPGESVSESERFLFGGRLLYDYNFSDHEQTMLKIGFFAVARQIPGMLRTALRLAWQADRTALSAVTVVLCTVSAWATARLEPKTERAATVGYLRRAARVELAALEDPEFSRLVESARFGTAAVRRLIGQSIAVLTALLGLVAAGGVLLTLDPVLLPMLVLIAAPQGWGAVRSARRRYGSVMAWLQHHRAAALLAQLLTQPQAAPEVRVHALGPFVLGHYTAMAEASELEQNRLARATAATSLLASALSGLAAAATFAVLGWLVHDGHTALAVAGTAVVASAVAPPTSPRWSAPSTTSTRKPCSCPTSTACSGRRSTAPSPSAAVRSPNAPPSSPSKASRSPTPGAPQPP